jgi:hypothetical protein
MRAIASGVPYGARAGGEEYLAEKATFFELSLGFGTVS